MSIDRWHFLTWRCLHDVRVFSSVHADGKQRNVQAAEPPPLPPSPLSINACQWQQAGWNWRKWKMFIWFPTLLSSSIYHPHTSLSCYRDIPMHDTTTTFNSKKTFCAEKHIKKRCKLPSWLFIFVIIIKHIYTDLPAKKSKVTFKSLGLHRGDLSGVQSVLTSFYSK